MNETRSGIIRLSEARSGIPGPNGEHAVKVLQFGKFDVSLALRPAVPPTLVTPHEEDEIYVIVGGQGVLFHDGQRDAFQAGDLLFVAAGVEHRFEDYSDDLAVWVVFDRPPGRLPFDTAPRTD